MIITIYWTDTRAFRTLPPCELFSNLAHSFESWRPAQPYLLRSYPYFSSGPFLLGNNPPLPTRLWWSWTALPPRAADFGPL
jgi:hypothetical protein